MSAIHTTYYFSTRGSVEVLTKQCDAIMDAMMDREALDPRVTDSTVSMDAELGIVEVEAYAEAESQEEAERLITDRIMSVVDATVGLTNATEKERRVELVGA